MEDMNKIDSGDDHFVPLNLGELGKTNTENNNNNESE